MRRFTSATLVSLIFFFASLTSFRNCGAWAMRKTPVGNDARRAYHRANGPRLAHRYSRRHSIFEKRSGRSCLLLTRRGLRFLFVRGLFLHKRAHQVHEVPAHLCRAPIPPPRHFSLAVPTYPQQPPARLFSSPT